MVKEAKPVSASMCVEQRLNLLCPFKWLRISHKMHMFEFTPSSFEAFFIKKCTRNFQFGILYLVQYVVLLRIHGEYRQPSSLGFHKTHT